MKKKITPKLILQNLDAIITGVTLTLCVILVNLNVIMRYILNAPLQWSEEVVTSLFVWTVFIGSAYAYRKHSHLGVDIVVNMMHGRTKAVVRDVMAIVELLILIMLTIISAQYVYNLIYVRGVFKPAVTDVLRIPKWQIVTREMLDISGFDSLIIIKESKGVYRLELSREAHYRDYNMGLLDD